MATNPLRLAMLGMVEGNGHPYSWSAIINGRYDAQVMADCGYPVIPQYLAANQNKLGIPGAKVTHVWTDNPAEAPKVAKASFIDQVVSKPTDVIGQVDAVFVATDIGSEHLERAKPFIDAGIPTFIDKPLADNRDDLLMFIDLYRQGKPILSTSCMRYAREVEALKQAKVGQPKLITGFTCKSWARYGIHALEGLYQLTGPGFVSVRDVGQENRHTVMLTHRSGVDSQLWAYYDAFGGFGSYQLIGSEGAAYARFTDTFHAFKRQIEVFIDFIRSGGRHPFPPEQTFEQIAIIAAAIESHKRGGKEIVLADFIPPEHLPR
ncbi:MAG: Gfo/Idh/MocA family oxidoreductase [Phycisphaerae bacterium]|nr:Gfo/Idh/MocA family oxidoreductase [Phycisphaerae bacterium]